MRPWRGEVLSEHGFEIKMRLRISSAALLAWQELESQAHPSRSEGSSLPELQRPLSVQGEHRPRQQSMHMSFRHGGEGSRRDIPHLGRLQGI